jgi:hypothetical protein
MLESIQVVRQWGPSIHDSKQRCISSSKDKSADVELLEDAYARSEEQAEECARRLCLEGCDKAVHANVSLLACMMHLTNGVAPRRRLVRRYLALWLPSDDNERSGLRGFP